MINFYTYDRITDPNMADKIVEFSTATGKRFVGTKGLNVFYRNVLEEKNDDHQLYGVTDQNGDIKALTIWFVIGNVAKLKFISSMDGELGLSIKKGIFNKAVNCITEKNPKVKFATTDVSVDSDNLEFFKDLGFVSEKRQDTEMEMLPKRWNYPQLSEVVSLKKRLTERRSFFR